VFPWELWCPIASHPFRSFKDSYLPSNAAHLLTPTNRLVFLCHLLQPVKENHETLVSAMASLVLVLHQLVVSSLLHLAFPFVLKLEARRLAIPLRPVPRTPQLLPTLKLRLLLFLAIFANQLLKNSLSLAMQLTQLLALELSPRILQRTAEMH
jgi:hypothetical protein